jgi:hypothetical protein
MREIADRRRIEAFLEALGREARAPASVFLVGGTTAVLEGWRSSTIDIDLVFRPESDELLRAIPALKERLQVNVELASPEMFIPVPDGWEQRSPLIRRIGVLTFHHYDLVAQALAKIERGHDRDLDDVRAMLRRGLITTAALRNQFQLIASRLYRYPAIDAPSFSRAVDTVCGITE